MKENLVKPIMSTGQIYISARKMYQQHGRRLQKGRITALNELTMVWLRIGINIFA